MTKETLRTASKLLGDFDNFINNRSIIFLAVLRDIFPKTLEWHFEMWNKEYEYLCKEDKLEELGSYSELSRILDSIVSKIEERALKERGSSYFFKCLKEHAKKYKKESVTEHYYINSLFSIFYRVFFENIGNLPNRFDVWEHYFPSEWKITKANLENTENGIFSRISLNNFLQWAQKRIWQVEEKFDSNLEDVSCNLFPEVEPMLWAQILIFVCSPYGENRVKSVIERPWNFGFMGRMRIYSADHADNEDTSRKKTNEMLQMAKEAEVNKTFELAHLLFKSEFSKENLEQYIKNLSELKYPEKSEEENKKLKLLDIFTRMLDFVNSQGQN